MSNYTASPVSDKEPGSFLSGFSIGLVAGAVGYFLFTTDRGEQVRKALQEEWKLAQNELEKAKTKTSVENLEDAEERVEQAAISIRDMFRKGIRYLADQVDTEPEQATSKSAKSKSSKKKKTSKKKTFSGV